MRRERSPGCSGVSSVVCPTGREPGSHPSQGARIQIRGTRVVGVQTPGFLAPHGPTWGQSSCRAVLWCPQAQSFPFRPEVLTLISFLHSWGNGVGVVPEQGMRWGLGLDASCRPASKTLLCGSPGRGLASGGAPGGRDPGSGESRQEGLRRMGGDSPGPG